MVAVPTVVRTAMVPAVATVTAATRDLTDHRAFFSARDNLRFRTGGTFFRGRSFHRVGKGRKKHPDQE